jgi:iron complex outermembrane receptor protein
LHAQNIEGTIKNIDNEVIAYANISVLNTLLGTSSQEDGTFYLKVPKGQYQISVSAVGYSTYVQNIIISDIDQELDIVLNPTIQFLGDVIVSANKKEENVLRAPTAVSSISTQQVENLRLWNLDGLNALVPNYLYQELGVGFQQVQSIRGIQVFSENPAVATYIDGVNNLDILANGFALTDIEKIEVLRGPQGTLFGRNAMGGVINITTKQPTNETKSAVEIGFGNLALQRHTAHIKLPIIKDKLFFGASALYQTRDGYWKNDTIGTNTIEQDIQGQLVGGEQNLYGNIFLKWLPSDNFVATLNVKAQRDWSDNTGFFVSQRDKDAALKQPNQINLARIGEHERNIVNSALSLKYYSSDFYLSSITSLQTIGLAFQDVDFPGFYHSFFDEEIGEMLPPQQVWSQEFRIQSNENNSKWQYTAGLFGFVQEGFEPSTNLAFELTPSSYAVFRNKSNNFGLAAFGELSYSVTDRLKLTGGVRYDYEFRESTFNGFGDAIFDGETLIELLPDTIVDGTYTAISPKLAISYELNQQTHIYASYARGFRAGGINAQKIPGNAQQSFDPEFSDNYEIGYKFLDSKKRYRINATAFLIQWTDLQFFNLVAPFTYARENVGDAQSYGLELELSAIPINRWQIDASVGLNQTQYLDFALTRVDFFTGETSTEDITDNSLSNAPSTTLFLGTQYTLPLSSKLHTVFRAEFRHIGSYFTDIQNQIEQEAYALINGKINFIYQQYQLEFWMQNITDERYLAFGNPDSSFGRNVRTAAPRTFGVSLKAAF